MCFSIQLTRNWIRTPIEIYRQKTAPFPAHIGSLSTFEMTCVVDVIYDGRTITILVIVDSGCQESLVLVFVDIQALNLTPLSTRETVMPDHSRATVEVYSEAMIRIRLTDGSYIEATVNPTYLTPVITEEVGVLCQERLLGHPAQFKARFQWENVDS